MAEPAPHPINRSSPRAGDGARHLHRPTVDGLLAGSGTWIVAPAEGRSNHVAVPLGSRHELAARTVRRHGPAGGAVCASSVRWTSQRVSSRCIRSKCPAVAAVPGPDPPTAMAPSHQGTGDAGGAELPGAGRQVGDGAVEAVGPEQATMTVSIAIERSGRCERPCGPSSNVMRSAPCPTVRGPRCVAGVGDPTAADDGGRAPNATRR